MTEQKKKLRPLILLLAVFACIRPLMSIFGLMEQIGQPLASIAVTAIISFVWIAAVVFVRDKQPIATLMFTGVAYGVLAIALSAVLSPILTGQLQGPITNPFAIVSVLLTNALWGAIAGFLASVWMRVASAK